MPEPATPRRKSYKKLKLPEQVKCMDWLRANWGHVQQTQPSYQDLSKTMSAALGFEVPLASVPPLVAALGFTWHAASRKGTPRVDRPRVLARAICDLYQRLGEPCPPEVQAICDCKPAADPDRPLLP